MSEEGTNPCEVPVSAGDGSPKVTAAEHASELAQGTLGSWAFIHSTPFVLVDGSPSLLRVVPKSVQHTPWCQRKPLERKRSIGKRAEYHSCMWLKG